MRLGVTLAALIVGLLSAELAVRAFDLGPPPDFEREGELLRAASFPGARFENQPGAVQRLTYPAYRGAPERRVEMRVNAQGFRGAAVPPERRAEVLRIACLGDSHTFGWGVEVAETWPQHLARELALGRPRERFEVLNCGVNNYDTVQEVALLEQRVLSYAPDLVVLQFYVNDAAVHGAQRARQPRQDLLLRWTRRGEAGVLARLRRSSRALDLVLDGLYRRRGLRIYASERTRLYAEDEPGWSQVREALRRARDLCAEREIPFVVALYPFLLRERDVLTSHAAFAVVSEFCASEAIPCIDTEPAFLGADVDALRISAQDYHGTGAANGIFARAVLQQLEAWRSIDSARERATR